MCGCLLQCSNKCFKEIFVQLLTTAHTNKTPCIGYQIHESCSSEERSATVCSKNSFEENWGVLFRSTNDINAPSEPRSGSTRYTTVEKDSEEFLFHALRRL